MFRHSALFSQPCAAVAERLQQTLDRRQQDDVHAPGAVLRGAVLAGARELRARVNSVHATGRRSCQSIVSVA